MLLSRNLIAMFVFLLALVTGASPLKAADCEDTLSRHWSAKPCWPLILWPWRKKRV